MRLLRIVGSIVLLLMVVVALAIGGLMYFIDPNKLRPALVEEVMAQTGYQLAIYGRLNWSFYPTVGIHVPRMTLIAPDQTKPFLDLHNLTVAADISQLFYGKKELLGDVRISNIVFMNVAMQNAHIGMRWQDKTLTIKPIKAFLYGGQLDGVATGKNLNQIPQWQWNITASDIQMKPLLEDVNGKQAGIGLSGIGKVVFNAKTQGLHKEDILSNLSGNGELAVANGEIDGIDINFLIKSAEALVEKEGSALPEKSNQTAFAELHGNVLLNNGIAETNNFALTAPLFQADAKGTLNLIHQGLNFAIEVKPNLANKSIDWAIPVLVTGSVMSPDVRLDVSQIQAYLAKREFKKVKEKVQEQIKEHVPGDAGKMLNHLLGN